MAAWCPRPASAAAALALVSSLLLLPPRAPVFAQSDPNVVVQITRPLPGERVRGTVEISGYAADLRGTDGSGLNENDIQVYVDDSSDPSDLIGYAGAGRPSPEAAQVLGAAFDRVGFVRLWDTCQVSPGPHDLIVWVSSLVVPGARGVNSVQVEIEPCPAPSAPAPTGTFAPSAPAPAAGPPSATPAPAPGAALAACSPAMLGALHPSGRALFEDDFTNPSSGWPRRFPDPAIGEAGYDGGEYAITKQAGTSLRPAVWTGSRFSDFFAEIDVRLPAPAQDAYAYLGFRRQDANNQYTLFVSPSDG